MHIEDHLLKMDDITEPQPFISHYPSPNYSNCNMAKQRYIVVHYSAALNESNTINWCTTPESKVSYHIIITRGGSIYQLVPFNRRAWHAGKGLYSDINNMNSYSIGICLCNVGPISPCYDKKYYVITKHNAPQEITTETPPLRAPYKYYNNHGLPVFTYWEPYTKLQLDLFTQLVLLLSEQYPIEEIIGHEDYAPTRKTDPGPAFFPLPMLISEFKQHAEYGTLTPPTSLQYHLPIRNPRRCTLCNCFIWLAYLKPRPETGNVSLSSSCSYDILCESCYNKKES